MKKGMSYVVRTILLVIVIGLLAFSALYLSFKGKMEESAGFWEEHMVDRISKIISYQDDFIPLLSGFPAGVSNVI